MSEARIIVHDERHYDELFALRTELFWVPNEDGSPSNKGRVVFHTMWYHFRDGVKFAESRGPRIEHDFDTILGRTFTVPIGPEETLEVPTALVMATIKKAFDDLANEHLAPPVLDDSIEEEPEEEPEEE